MLYKQSKEYLLEKLKAAGLKTKPYTTQKGLEKSQESHIGAVLFEQNDEWQSQHRYMQVEAFAQIDAAESDPLLSITTQAA